MININEQIENLNLIEEVKEQELLDEVVEAEDIELTTFLENLVVRVDDLESAVKRNPRKTVPLPNGATLQQVITKINEIISKLRLN